MSDSNNSTLNLILALFALVFLMGAFYLFYTKMSPAKTTGNTQTSKPTGTAAGNSSAGTSGLLSTLQNLIKGLGGKSSTGSPSGGAPKGGGGGGMSMGAGGGGGGGNYSAGGGSTKSGSSSDNGYTNAQIDAVMSTDPTEVSDPSSPYYDPTSKYYDASMDPEADSSGLSAGEDQGSADLTPGSDSLDPTDENSILYDSEA